MNIAETKVDQLRWALAGAKKVCHHAYVNWTSGKETGWPETAHPPTCPGCGGAGQVYALPDIVRRPCSYCDATEPDVTCLAEEHGWQCDCRCPTCSPSGTWECCHGHGYVPPISEALWREALWEMWPTAEIVETMHSIILGLIDPMGDGLYHLYRKVVSPPGLERLLRVIAAVLEAQGVKLEVRL